MEWKNLSLFVPNLIVLCRKFLIVVKAMRSNQKVAGLVKQYTQSAQREDDMLIPKTGK